MVTGKPSRRVSNREMIKVRAEERHLYLAKNEVAEWPVNYSVEVNFIVL